MKNGYANLTIILSALLVCLILAAVPAIASEKIASHKQGPGTPSIKYQLAGNDLSDKSYRIPRVSVNPADSLMPALVFKPGSLRAKKSAALAGVKYAKVSAKDQRVVAAPTLAVSATKKPFAPAGVRTPAESYGIYGASGARPTPRAAIVVVRLPSASSGAQSVNIPYAGGITSARGSTGQCGCVPLSSDLRYAGRGPGIVGSTLVVPPSSAPGPLARPTVIGIIR